MNSQIASNIGDFAGRAGHIWNLGTQIHWSLVALVAGLAVAVIALICILVHRSKRWQPVTGRAVSCSVEAMPAIFVRSKKIVQINCDYTYELRGASHQGAQSVLLDKDACFDARRHARRMMSEGVTVFCREDRPEISRLSLPNATRSLIIFGLGLLMTASASVKMILDSRPQSRVAVSRSVLMSPRETPPADRAETARNGKGSAAGVRATALTPGVQIDESTSVAQH